MLVIGRREDEGVMIGEHIRVSVVRIKGGYVRLGIEAPQSLSISRCEIAADYDLAAAHAAKHLDDQTICEAAADPDGGGEPQPEYQ